MRKQSTARPVTLDQATISRFVAAKGERLHRAEVVDFLDHLSVGQRRVYIVAGDHGTYRVTLMTYAEPWTGTCGCPSRGMCSHLRAAQLRELETRIVQAADWVDRNVKLHGFAERHCPQHGRTSAELDVAEVTETGEKVDYCHAGEHMVERGKWVQAAASKPTCRDCGTDLEPDERRAGICGQCLFARL